MGPRAAGWLPAGLLLGCLACGPLRAGASPEDPPSAVVAPDALGEEERSLDQLIARMEEREAEAAALAAQLDGLKREYEANMAALGEERARYDANATRLQQEAYAEAAGILREARRQANLIIRELREKADVAAAEQQRQMLLESEKAAAAEAERLAPRAAPEGEGGGTRASMMTNPLTAWASRSASRSSEAVSATNPTPPQLWASSA